MQHAQLLMPRQGKREQPRPPLKKNGWVSQRIKPFPVELPSVHVKEEKKRDKPEQRLCLTFDDLPKIRDKASKWLYYKNSLHLARKNTWIFVRRHYLFQEVNRFLGAKLKENCVNCEF